MQEPFPPPYWWVTGAARNGEYRSSVRLFAPRLSKSLRAGNRISPVLSLRQHSDPVLERRACETVDGRNRTQSFRTMTPLRCLSPNSLQPPSNRSLQDVPASRSGV